jgi:hypothetical protein
MIDIAQALPEVAAAGFRFPAGYLRVLELGLTKLDPWLFLDSAEALLHRYEGLRKRYPSRLVLPFARRHDCDDVAAFVIKSEGHRASGVVLIHDFAQAGMEVDAAYPTFWDWYRSAVEDFIERQREEEDAEPPDA